MPHAPPTRHPLGDRGFFTWTATIMPLNLTRALDVETSGASFLRIGLVALHASTSHRTAGAARHVSA